MFTTHILASGLEDVEYSKYTIEQLGELLLAEFKSIEARGGFKRMVKRIDDEISKHGYAADHSGYGVWKKVNGHYVYEQLRTRKTHMASWEEVWLHLEIFPRETDHFSLVGYIKPNGSYSIVAFDP
ncbi:hypothetical protein KY316_00065, partial [Candidatus Woesearchaeota archaeon]|nr:hypothetical protein [Candidatus Woesearchaeota archaeon]